MIPAHVALLCGAVSRYFPAGAGRLSAVFDLLDGASAGVLGRKREEVADQWSRRAKARRAACESFRESVRAALCCDGHPERGGICAWCRNPSLQELRRWAEGVSRVIGGPDPLPKALILRCRIQRRRMEAWVAAGSDPAHLPPDPLAGLPSSLHPQYGTCGCCGQKGYDRPRLGSGARHSVALDSAVLEAFAVEDDSPMDEARWRRPDLTAAQQDLLRCCVTARQQAAALTLIEGLPQPRTVGADGARSWLY